MKKAWQDLKRAQPGRRFQARHERARGRRGGAARKWLVIAGGALLVLAGIAFLPLPGPGVLIIAAGGLLMAEESRAAARSLDWIELRVRSAFSSLRRSR